MKATFLAVLAFGLPVVLSAQFLNFQFSDGTVRSEPTASLKRMLVTPTHYEVLRNDGSVSMWPVDSVLVIGVGSIATAVGGESARAEGFTIQPNPVTGSSTLTHTLPESGTVQLHLTDLEGRLVRGTGNLQRGAGTHHEPLLSLLDPEGTLASGTYLCSLRTPQGMRTLTILIQR
jgi:hypothetical protein